MIKELTAQLSEARDDYNHLKADMAAHDARLTAIEQHLSNPESTPITPPTTVPMEVSPAASTQDATIINSSGPSIPLNTDSQHNAFDERLSNIDNRYTRMERALGTITNMLSSFTGNSVYDSLNSQ
jgi:hypothetical protein